jgi:integrase
LSSDLKRELAALKNSSKFNYIFRSDKGTPFDQSNIRNRIWNRNIKETGVRYIRLHDGRHTYSSHFVMNGGSIYDLKDLLGHANSKTTERYSHLSPEHQAKHKNRVTFDYQECEDNVVPVNELLERKSSSRLIHAEALKKSENDQNV